MARVRLKFVKREHRGGKTYYYFRRKGFPRVALPGLPGTAEFAAAYDAALRGAPQPIGEDRTAPGSINALIAAFYGSHKFTKNKPITKATDRNILEAFRVRHGDKPVAQMESRHVINVLDEKAGKPAARRNLLRVLRVLLDFAVSRGLRQDNPARSVKLDPLRTDGFHSWTEEELQQFEARWPIGTTARLVLAVALYTMQRRSDVVKLGPPNMHKGERGEDRLRFTQSKTGTPMDIPLWPPLAEVLAATNTVGLNTFIVTTYGRPFSAAGLGNAFRDWCNEAGLQHCSLHGLRKAAARRMAEAGCSEEYIASFGGWRDMREIRVYTRAANRARMADQGMAMTLARFPGTTK